ncbi:MAG: hypothetical protein ABIV63_08290 [Caldimonas sp.]
MSGLQFRIWFGERAASADELARVEEIEVTQEMDAFWEAHVRMALCLDANGSWLHWPGETATPFSRVRIEIDAGDGRFVALIDGPLAAIDGTLDAQPGRSTATLVVRDDSAFLDRDEEVEKAFEKKRDSEVAEILFKRFPQIDSTRIEATDGAPATTMRRGTALTFLRRLARANGRHAYVLPGDEPGKSIGCFLPDPSAAAVLPKLVMIGDARNLAEARITQDPRGPERTRARVLRVDDQSVTTFETGAQDLGLLRDVPALPADLTPRRLLHPADNPREDPKAAVSGQARRHGYVYRLKGRVVPGCYAGVLAPYRKVRVDAGATPYSGDYLLTRVTHRITPSIYTQEFDGKADSLTDVAAPAVAEALGGGLRLAVSASAGIF